MGAGTAPAEDNDSAAEAAKAAVDVDIEQQDAVDGLFVLEADVMSWSDDRLFRTNPCCGGCRLDNDDECCNIAEVVASLRSQPFMQLVRSQCRGNGSVLWLTLEVGAQRLGYRTDTIHKNNNDASQCSRRRGVEQSGTTFVHCKMPLWL